MLTFRSASSPPRCLMPHDTCVSFAFESSSTLGLYIVLHKVQSKSYFGSSQSQTSAVTRPQLLSNISFWLLRNVIFDSIRCQTNITWIMICKPHFQTLYWRNSKLLYCLSVKIGFDTVAEWQPKFRKKLSLVTKI